MQTAIAEIRKVRSIVSLEPLDERHANVVDFVSFEFVIFRLISNLTGSVG